MLKVCKGCTAEYAHSLENCPQCRATDFVWSTALPDGWRQLLDSHQATLDSLLQGQPEEADADVPQQWTSLDRPKDSDTAEKWKAFARSECVRRDLPPAEWPDIDNMTRAELIKAFGALEN